MPDASLTHPNDPTNFTRAHASHTTESAGKPTWPRLRALLGLSQRKGAGKLPIRPIFTIQEETALHADSVRPASMSGKAPMKKKRRPDGTSILWRR